MWVARQGGVAACLRPPFASRADACPSLASSRTRSSEGDLGSSGIAFDDLLGRSSRSLQPTRRKDAPTTAHSPLEEVQAPKGSFAPKRPRWPPWSAGSGRDR